MCLVGARARTLPRHKSKKTAKLSTPSEDDSGSKLRDKEQQRLSSK